LIFIARLRPGLLVVAALVLAVACGSDDEANGETADQRPAGAAVPDSALALPNGPLTDLSDFQKEILSDGVLTLAEYERAILAYRTCIEGYGYRIDHEYMPTKNHGYGTYSSRVATVGETDTERAFAEAGFKACERDYIEALGFVWSLDNRPSEEERQRARDAFATCMHDQGEEFPDHPSEADFSVYVRTRAGEGRGTPAAFKDCSIRIGDEFDMPFFGG
jgi:hypothetical protein